MAKWAIIFGLLLTGLGLYGYFSHDPDNLAHSTPRGGQTQVDEAANVSGEKAGPSPTALIPSAFGMLLLICGTLGLDERMRKHAMHVAAGVSLLGTLAGAGRLASKFSDLLAGNISRPMWFVLGMTAMCALYLVMSFMSFRAARKKNALAA